MILADTSVWVQHFRRGRPDFAQTLHNGQIVMHAVVIGELATGNLARRDRTLAALCAMPRVKAGTFEECLAFIERFTLQGRGIGWNDVQLLVAARLSGHLLWSMDARLAEAARELGVGYAPGS